MTCQKSPRLTDIRDTEWRRSWSRYGRRRGVVSAAVPRLTAWLAHPASPSSWRAESWRAGTYRHLDGAGHGEESPHGQRRPRPRVRARRTRRHVLGTRGRGQATAGPGASPRNPHPGDDRAARRRGSSSCSRPPPGGDPNRRQRQPRQHRVQQRRHRHLPQLAPRTHPTSRPSCNAGRTTCSKSPNPST